MKSLIAITTCNRLSELKKNIIPFLKFCKSHPNFDFVIALDGLEDDYISFCQENSIPLIYSDEREGVGLSRNRVYENFPNHDYYFFLDDDLELLDGSVFSDAIELSQLTSYSHFSPSHTVGILKKEKIHGHTIIHTKFGGGYFLMYTGECLKKIGGWHTLFAKYKRYGHTEHSYRAYFQKLNPSPFIYSKNFKSKVFLNSPESVTSLNAKQNENHLIQDEQDLIDQEHSFFPFTTLSKHHFNGMDLGLNDVSQDLLSDRYQLISGDALQKAKSKYFFEKFRIYKNPLNIFKSYKFDRKNPHFKHYLKIKYLTILINLGIKKNY